MQQSLLMLLMRPALALLVLLSLARVPAQCAAASAARDGASSEPFDATVAFWPRDVGDTLSHARDPGELFLQYIYVCSIPRALLGGSGSDVLFSKRRGFLGTFASRFNTEIEIAWVPPVRAESSTFEQFFSHSPNLLAAHAVGIHIQVTPSLPVHIATFVNESNQHAIEVNVQEVLREVFPTSGVLPPFQAGFLAKSLCNYQNWKSSEPMADGFKAASSPSTSLCYSSTFSFPAETAATRGLPVFVNSDAKSTTTESEKEEGSVLEAYFQKKLVAFEYAKRVTQVTLQRSSSSDAQPSTLSTDILEAWIAESSQLPISWQYADLHPKESPIRSLVVSTIHQDHPPSIEYLSLQRGNGESPTIGKSSLVLKQQQFASDIVPASVNVSIAGEGFHRRFAIDVVVSEDAQQRCAEPERKLLLRVPLSHEVYADLDELRRMERFGELRLFAFSKHIEIERPSPVSPQHTIALEFPMSSSGKTHIEFPIHFRYQAPSNSDLYRSASIVAPEFFLYCPRDRSTRQDEDDIPNSSSEGASEEDIHASYFQTWLSSSSDSAWQRLRLKYPIDVDDVATPVGFLPSGPFVSAMTLSVASLGALLLVVVAVTRPKTASASRQNEEEVSSHWKLKSS